MTVFLHALAFSPRSLCPSPASFLRKSEAQGKPGGLVLAVGTIGTRGNLLTISALTDMTEDYEVRSPRILTSEERKARDALRRAEAEQAMREHEAAQKAFYENRERLRAARLAREAGADRK
jgi:hypothetical protein